jgi:hypothetical protein
MKSPRSSQGSVADILAEARLQLDEAVAALEGTSASRLSVSRLRAVADNTHCQNTGCGGAARQAADTSSG